MYTLYSVLEMTVLQKWRRGYCFLGVKDGESGVAIKEQDRNPCGDGHVLCPDYMDMDVNTLVINCIYTHTYTYIHIHTHTHYML